MFVKTCNASHHDMRDMVANDELRDRYPVTGLFRTGEVVLDCPHNERFVTGGATPGAAPRPFPVPTAPASVAGKPMSAQGRGAIINIASMLTFRGGIRVPSYTASKCGVGGLTKRLAASASDDVDSHILAVDGGGLAR